MGPEKSEKTQRKSKKVRSKKQKTKKVPIHTGAGYPNPDDAERKKILAAAKDKIQILLLELLPQDSTVADVDDISARWANEIARLWENAN